MIKNRMRGVYKIENKLDGKAYIGSSSNIEARWYEHKRALDKGEHVNRNLQSAWVAWGKNNFNFEILELVECRGNLFEAEQRWMNEYHSYEMNKGYNICPFAGSSYGFRHCDETRELLSAFARRRVSSGNNHLVKHQFQKGETLSVDMRKKISEGHKGIHTGEKHPRSVLSESDVRRILELLEVGYSCASIARTYSVDRKTISNIKCGRSWSHILNRGAAADLG